MDKIQTFIFGKVYFSPYHLSLDNTNKSLIELVHNNFKTLISGQD
ncbi:hypothetical protein SLEP1_g56754 [Rubroshorea leprosula]|uniref:Uncharacterized protein n=1 Tax=Rubroshorea leprosula TaxID=152421 RepID=A0AAV5MLL3_9ROSI|nr:hypothetical protein SLEP1_g56754 [Rubroshorea leprosula]